ncbi:MAG: hypothetical protein ACFB9M_02530 [Myxococcota bacterium]
MRTSKVILTSSLIGLAACGEVDPIVEGPAASEPLDEAPGSAEPTTAEPATETRGELQRAHVTRLELLREPGPAYLNERIPIVLGITAESVESSAVAVERLPVVVSFVDPEHPDDDGLGCSSNALDLEVVGDGTEHTYEAHVWPVTECVSLVDRTVALRVDIDPAAEDRRLDSPLITSRERAEDEVNRACRGPSPGCIHELTLLVSDPGPDGRPIVDVELVDLSADSSVALLPLDSTVRPDQVEGSPETLQPSLQALLTLVLNGREPDQAPVDPSTLPPELEASAPGIAEDLRFGLSPEEVERLDDLPGLLRVRYAISPRSDGQTFLPLTIGTEEGRVDEAIVTKLRPGTEHILTHDLYLEGSALDAVIDGGRWLEEDDFLVRGCIVTDFPQIHGAPVEGECQTIEVVLIEERTEDASLTTSLSFDGGFDRGFGGRRMRVGAEFETRNRLTESGLSAHAEGKINLRGRIAGRSYDVALVRGFGTTESPASSDGSVNLGLTMFGVRLFSHDESGSALRFEQPIRLSRSFLVKELSFGFGPVRIKFELHAGGGIGIDASGSLALNRGESVCRPHLPAGSPVQRQVPSRRSTRRTPRSRDRGSAPAPAPPPLPPPTETSPEDEIARCMVLETEVAPGFNLSASAFGGVDIRIAKAGLSANLILAQTELPLQSQLSWGQDVQGRTLVHASTFFDLEFQPLLGDISIVGRLGFRRFSVSKSVTLVSFETRKFTRRLLSRGMRAAEFIGE